MGMEFVLPLPTSLLTHTYTYAYIHIHIPIHITHTCIHIYVYYTYIYTTHVQGSFWKYLSQPASEKFFHEIHNHFQEAQAELKKQAEGLKKLDERTSLVSTTLRRRAGAKETNCSKLISRPSMEQRDLHIRTCMQ